MHARLDFGSVFGSDVIEMHLDEALSIVAIHAYWSLSMYEFMQSPTKLDGGCHLLVLEFYL